MAKYINRNAISHVFSGMQYDIAFLVRITHVKPLILEAYSTSEVHSIMVIFFYELQLHNPINSEDQP